MMKLFDWPALALDGEPLPFSLHYERGVWGKVHGAPTDYRWIAQSDGFGRDRPDQLNLGAEDVPSSFQAWRNLGDRCHAVNVYRSRAMDAAGRTGFIEKHILEWHRPPGVPAALGALLLLPEVARMNDAIWWERGADVLSSGSSFILRIPPEDFEPLAIDETRIAKAVERGVDALQEALTPKVVEQLYDQLLAGCRPACLPQLVQPLPPEALAALLLPLPREISDSISLAGWIPSNRPSLEELGTRWNVLVVPPGQPIPPIPPPSRREARTMMSMLLTAEEQPPSPAVVASKPSASPSAPKKEVPFRPGVKLEVTAPEPNSPRILLELHRFAADPSRRWLYPEALRHACGGEIRFPSPTVAEGLFVDWIPQVDEQWPRSYAHERQWEVKVDLLRSAAIIFSPEPSTVRAVGTGKSGRVPILFCGMILQGRKELGRLERLDRGALRQLLDQSVNCAGSPFWKQKFREWLEKWRRESSRADIQALIGDAL